ncbi:MAG: hypothetical protein F6K32_12430 [Desertifilum sp. SIO1I2]|nr:hypothetical protein [Desertifilum sp. SIO1I2]
MVLVRSKQKTQEQPLPTLPAPPTKKELAAQKRKAANDRSAFIAAAAQAIAIGAVLGGIGFAVGGDKAGLGGFVATVILLLSAKYPRQAIWAFLMFLPISGTVTYSVGGGSPLFQLAKDAFYIPALFGFYKYCQRERLPFLLPKKFVPWVYALLGYCVLVILAVNATQASAPGEKPILLGILGLKVFMGYIPLITCAYYLIRSKKEFLFLTRSHVIFAIICCALCFIQYSMLQSGRCEGTRNLVGADLFKANLDARCFVGGSLAFSPQVNMIRLPGTFVSPWHWAWFMISNAFFTFATAFSDPSPLWRLMGLGGMASVFVCAVISGQRIALILVPIITVILLVLTGQFTNLKRFIPIAIGLAILLGGAMTMYPEVVQERWDSTVSRWNASPPTEFIAAQAAHTADKTTLLGAGIGRATNSARTFGKTTLIETWFPKILYEAGWPGLILFLLMVTSLTVLTFKAYRSVRDRNFRSFGACFWVFILIISYQTYWYPLDTDPVAVYYWFFAGVLLRLPEIDKRESLQADILAQQAEQNSKKKRGKKKGKAKTRKRK